MLECTYICPVGKLVICEEDSCIIGLHPDENAADTAPCSQLLTEARRQLDEYFSGRRTVFELPLSPKGTAFQHRVWNELKNVPYGKTACYQDIAASIGNIKASRAVGQAVNKNPIMIIIPCHRIISKDGNIGGFAYDISVKRYLLELEHHNI